jgi:2-oxoglutarate dehydrogenase E1 component
MSPKSLLRHPAAVSPIEEFTDGAFRPILGDARPEADPARVERVLLCSGKIYYDLAKEQRDRGRDDVAILRLEQLYPLEDEALAAALAPYPAGTPVLWVQEEPENMGAWHYLKVRYCGELPGGHPLGVVSREASASPATGSASSHQAEQRMILDEAFGGSA